MERFSEGQNVVVSSSQDVNFSDVFGGPPRRSSMYAEEEEEVSYRGMAVFGGEDSSNQRRRRRGNDFFNDIFRSGESCSSLSTPRKQQHDPIASAPGVKPDPFGTSAPSPSSLSPKLPKPMDLPTFGSPPRRSKDQASEGVSSSSPRATLSRSSQSIQDQENKNDIHSFYHQSSLSREVSLNSEDIPSAVISERAGNSKNSSDGLQFHFSIYKWASKGAPMDIMRGRNTSRMPKPQNVQLEFTTAAPHDTDKPFFVRKDDHLLLTTITQRSQMAEEESISLPEPATISGALTSASSHTILNSNIGKMKPDSHSQVGLGGKPNKPTPTAVQETLKFNNLKPVRSLLNDSIEQDNDNKSVKSARNKTNEKAFVKKFQAAKKEKSTDCDSR